MEEKLLVRLGGAVAEMLNEMVRRGYFSTKSEAVRAGILRLGETFGLIGHPPPYWRELGEEIKRSGKRLTHEEILEAVGRLERET